MLSVARMQNHKSGDGFNFFTTVVSGLKVSHKKIRMLDEI